MIVSAKSLELLVYDTLKVKAILENRVAFCVDGLDGKGIGSCRLRGFIL
jgi:hypothetical protein